jgi:hypothetical protein
MLSADQCLKVLAFETSLSNRSMNSHALHEQQNEARVPLSYNICSNESSGLIIKTKYKVCEFPYMTSSNPGDRNIYRNFYSTFCYSVDISRNKDEGGIDRNVNIIMFSQAFNYRK